MNTATTFQNSNTSKIPIVGLLLLALIAVLTFAITANYTPPTDIFRDNRLKMERREGSGKNGKHANADAREKARQEFEKVRDEYQQWNKKPNKTPDEKKFIEKLRNQLERLRKKKDFSGEHHSQKPKGK